MKIHLSRAVVATGLGVSLWFGSIAAVAAPQQSKDQTQTPATQSQTSQSQTAQPNQKSTTQRPQQTASNGKTLSTNDDPNMIGKRNINGGVWGKLASGTEKEVKMGRMLAAQVDKEAKFVDDPIITEYVNRVGQNIVLHSDAKVPFFEGMAFLKFSRGAEEEADKLGVQYMWAAGYDPSAMATMFEKLEAKNKKKPGTISKMFADHPAPADRRQAALNLAARFPEREEYVISSSEFQRVKNRLLRLSNARITNTGAIAASDDDTPGRPTLKRRTPTPDDSTTTNPDGTTTPKTDSTKPAAPTLRRNPDAQPTPTPQP